MNERKGMKRTFSGMILSLLLLGILTSAFNVPHVKTDATTIVVPSDYPKIQEAIDNADEGDTIHVKVGTYYENVVVNKSVMLVGENRTLTVIDGNKANHVIRIGANNVTIRGFTVQNSATDFSGIKVLSSYNNIVNNIVSRNHYGIILDDCSDTIVGDNLVSNNRWGIYAKSSNNTIIRNTISYNLDGIHLRGSYTTVAHNILSGNSFAIYLIVSTNNAVVSNEVSDSQWGIELVRSNHVMVVGNTVSECNDAGIGLAYCSNNTIYHNNFVNNTDQAFILQSCNNTWDNDAEGNYWSNYNGTDSDGDGIGDSPYVIDENNQDDFPLMHLYGKTYIYELGGNLVDAPANKAYFLYADSAYMARPEATYDIASGSLIYGLCTNTQHQGFNTTKHWLLDTGVINTTTINGATVAMFGGPYPHVAVRCYENSHLGSQHGNRLAPVKFAENATHYWFVNQTDAVVGMLPISAVINGHEDMFVIEVFMDGDNTILVVYGFDWRGTWAGGIYFKEVMSENLSNYRKQYYVFHWVDDSGEDGIPQSSEIVMVSSG